MRKQLKTKKNVKQYVLITAIVACVFLVAGSAIVKADLSFWDKVAQWAGTAIADKVDVPDLSTDENLGAFPSNDIYEKVRFHDGFLANSSIDFSFTQVATSSDNYGTSTAAGYYCHKDIKSLYVSHDWWWEIQTANGLWQSNWRIGTTTCRSLSGQGSCGTTNDNSSWTATSSATLMASCGEDYDSKTTAGIATSTTGMFSKVDMEAVRDQNYGCVLGSFYGGTNGLGYTTTSTKPWILSTGDCIVVWNDHKRATSSASYTTAGGFTPTVGTFHADAWYR